MKHNKLVRDKIPSIIRGKGEEAIVEILPMTKMREALLTKLLEGLEEYKEATAPDRFEELADILEVLYALASMDSISMEKLEEIRAKKAAERGDFSDRVFLIETKPAA